ncbi:MAG TPA: DUF6644 family protein [Steroidobacteraceae bacterium]|nr:DUF6644 family protein [Steroidobacteraceae bacterium]
MSLHDTLFSLQNSGIAHLISKSNHLVGAALQIVHVAGFILLLSSLVLIGLRILRVVFKDQSIADVTQDANRLFWWGLALAFGSGTLMFISTATLYAYKWAFQLKLVLFALALILQFTLFRKIARTDAANSLFAKGTVVTSLLVWFGVGFAGRMIGFV